MMKIHYFRIFMILICLGLVVFIFGCSSLSGYSFRQNTDMIVSIEIYDTLGCELTAEEVSTAGVFISDVNIEKRDELVNDLKTIKYSGYFMDPTVRFCGYVIKITYSDGSLELINGWISAYFDCADWEYRLKVLNPDEFDLLVKKYLK